MLSWAGQSLDPYKDRDHMFFFQRNYFNLIFSTVAAGYVDPYRSAEVLENLDYRRYSDKVLVSQFSPQVYPFKRRITRYFINVIVSF